MTLEQLNHIVQQYYDKTLYHPTKKELIELICSKYSQWNGVQNTWPPIIEKEHINILKKEFLSQTNYHNIRPMECKDCDQIIMSKDMESSDICRKCGTSRAKSKLRKEMSANGLTICPVPECLENLTYPEKLCIAL